MSFLSYIPSPGSAAIHIGPLQLRAYGLMIALGVIVAVRIWGKRMTLIGHPFCQCFVTLHGPTLNAVKPWIRL